MQSASVVEDTKQGPRERLVMHGAASLSDAELVAVLLGTGYSGESVEVVAARLLARAGGLHGLQRLRGPELEAQPGVGLTKACRLRAAAELGARLCYRPLRRQEPITCSRDVEAALRPRLARAEREHFVAIALDAKNHPLAQLEIAVGGLLACCISPADVFRPLLREAAASTIFAHNHPSGDPTPSEQDLTITERLCQAGELLGVRVLDHLVIGAHGYFSFLDAGLLAPKAPR